MIDAENTRQKDSSRLTLVGLTALFESDDFDIEIVGDEYQIIMKVPDPGGYKKVKAQHLVDPIMSILKEDY